MDIIEKNFIITDEKILKKIILERIRYNVRNDFLLSKKAIIYMLMCFLMQLVLAYHDSRVGVITVPLYQTPWFITLIFSISLFTLTYIQLAIIYRELLKTYRTIGEQNISIHAEGITVFYPEYDSEPFELDFQSMENMQVFQNYILYSVRRKTKIRLYRTHLLPVLSLSDIERKQIELWYEIQKGETLQRHPKRKKKLIDRILITGINLVFIGCIFIMLADTFGNIYFFEKSIDYPKEILAQNEIKEENSADSEVTIEQQEPVEEPVYMVDEDLLIEELNERQVYKENCSFYGEVVSYWENVREVRDIGNQLEPLYRTNEIFYTKEYFQNDPPLIIYLARNEIYARHGYIFKDADLDNYFRAMLWYEPLYTADEFDAKVFNECEQHNLRVLKEIDTYERN